jgi:hypothetical protein
MQSDLSAVLKDGRNEKARLIVQVVEVIGVDTKKLRDAMQRLQRSGSL